jgi:K+-sensing histidine kinase KdpD
VIVNAVTTRAAHKIFLGMAPGVGKTYQMLDEAHEEKDRGRDVAIGYLESHGRPETLSQAEGLEADRQRLVDHKAGHRGQHRLQTLTAAVQPIRGLVHPQGRVTTRVGV